MSERPKRQSHSEGCDSKYYEQYDSVYMKHKGEKLCNCVANGWNACIDAWEDWEKENPRLERLSREKLYEIRGKVEEDFGVEQYELRGDDGDYTPSANEQFLMEDFHEGFMEEFFNELLKTFGQPKDAVSVENTITLPIEEAQELIEKAWKYDQLCK